MTWPIAVAFFCAAIIAPVPAQAAPALDGEALGWPWVLPLVGLLLTVATGPRLFPKIWRRHTGKLAAMWAILALAPLAALHGGSAAAAAFVHMLLADYLSFIVLLFALYVVAGGILITGHLPGTPLVNAGILALGTLLGSLVGTIAAAMILIRPLLQANAARLHNTHVVVFFIILVGNVGGALSPLGDPPLYAGFLRGVDAFWPAQHLWQPTAAVAGLLLVVFLAVDGWIYYRKDRMVTLVGEAKPRSHLRLRGAINLALLAAVIAVVLGAGWWRPGLALDLYGTHIELLHLLRDLLLVFIALLSLALTPNEHSEGSGFSFEPIRQAAILFAGLFACLIPILAMLQAGRAGAFGALLALAGDPGQPSNIATFWLTGLLSAALSNAPAYLAVFRWAGGDPQALMGPFAGTLAAISMGAVLMGALTYIGNAPNLMIQAIAQERGVKMPGFLGYLGWAALILLPPLVLVSVLFVRP